ncbi:MAG: heme ABC exporter ATP-binding protein CcmA [Anaerolineae bacterium]|nr:heme ABC exporter ATP-binding protein CcmA [Anaerolineae bacterium]
MIRVRELVKAFGPRRALSGIDLDIATGERVMLVGPNGAGKTTFLRILATLSRPTSGEVVIDGYNVATSGAEVRKAIGYLSHETLLYEDLTAVQNLRFYARMYGLVDAMARIETLVAKVGLSDRRDDLVRTYSRGMRQRLAVARAVLHRPTVLLLDEPYTSLDASASEMLTQLLGGLVEEGCTMVLTTHRPADEGQLANRRVTLEGGRIVEDVGVGDGTPEAGVQGWAGIGAGDPSLS